MPRVVKPIRSGHHAAEPGLMQRLVSQLVPEVPVNRHLTSGSQLEAHRTKAEYISLSQIFELATEHLLRKIPRITLGHFAGLGLDCHNSQAKIRNLVGLHCRRADPAGWLVQLAQDVLRLDIQMNQLDSLPACGPMDPGQAAGHMLDDEPEVVIHHQQTHFSLVVVKLPEVGVAELRPDVQAAILNPCIKIPHNVRTENAVQSGNGFGLLVGTVSAVGRGALFASLDGILAAVHLVPRPVHRREMSLADQPPIHVFRIEAAALLGPSVAVALSAQELGRGQITPAVGSVSVAQQRRPRESSALGDASTGRRSLVGTRAARARGALRAEIPALALCRGHVRRARPVRGANPRTPHIHVRIHRQEGQHGTHVGGVEAVVQVAPEAAVICHAHVAVALSIHSVRFAPLQDAFRVD
mmetsp:Transcript_24404/g.59214  ORF Transcript_24404/g.59214 Transcript_24404/m.59214 type:complete len:412 (+) Transcript_24404:374-1609(+)